MCPGNPTGWNPPTGTFPNWPVSKLLTALEWNPQTAGKPKNNLNIWIYIFILTLLLTPFKSSVIMTEKITIKILSSGFRAYFVLLFEFLGALFIIIMYKSDCVLTNYGEENLADFSPWNYWKLIFHMVVTLNYWAIISWRETFHAANDAVQQGF